MGRKTRSNRKRITNKPKFNEEIDRNQTEFSNLIRPTSKRAQEKDEDSIFDYEVEREREQKENYLLTF